MPFPSFIFIIPKYTNIRIKVNMYREEGWFDFSHKKMSSCKSEKVSESISNSFQASITVELIVCIPLFIYAALCLIWLLEIRTIQTVIRCGLHATAKEMVSEWSEYPVVPLFMCEQRIVSAIGEERLEKSCIVGGARGIHCEKSYMIPGSGIYEWKVEYQVKIPFPFFDIRGIPIKEQIRMKAWTGYEAEWFSQKPLGKIVYVTETGIVYHLDYNCNYLELSVRGIEKNLLDEMRNESGEIYKPCSACRHSGSGKQVYITSYGTRYHTSALCPGLKRKIYAVSIDEVKGKVVCSKCGKNG